MRILKGRKLEFELPTSFANPDKFRPHQIDDAVLARVPEFVSNALFDALDAQVPIDPLSPFIYLRQGKLPHFVVIYFMEIQGMKKNLGNQRRFFQAMHLIEAYREYVIVPPAHFLSAQPTVDTAAAKFKGRKAGESSSSVDKDEGTKVEESSSSVDKEEEKSSEKEKEDKSSEK